MALDLVDVALDSVDVAFDLVDVALDLVVVALDVVDVPHECVFRPMGASKTTPRTIAFTLQTVSTGYIQHHRVLKTWLC